MPRKTTPRLSEALDQFLAIRAAHTAKTTLANDQALLRKFVREVGDPQVHQLDAMTVENWFAGEAMRQKPSSYNKVRTRVQNLVAFCTRRGWLTFDPMAEIRPRKVARQQRLQLSPAQMRDLIESTDNPRDRGMLATSCNTGLRAGDLGRLRVGDVALDRGDLHVTIQKTGDVDRLPITADLDQELRRWLGWYAERLEYVGQALQDDFLLFPALGHRNVRRNGVMQSWGDPQPSKVLTHPARVVQRALERIGVLTTTHEGFHTLRRSVGRTVFEQAVTEGHDGALRVTAGLLGHKNVATTEHYLGISHDRVKRDQLLKGRSLLGSPATVTPLRQAR
jgi:integrase